MIVWMIIMCEIVGVFEDLFLCEEAKFSPYHLAGPLSEHTLEFIGIPYHVRSLSLISLSILMYDDIYANFNGISIIEIQ